MFSRPANSADINPRVRLGKVRGNVFPAEFLLQQFAQDLTNPVPSWSQEVSVCEWEGIVCNDQLEVEKVDLRSRKLRGVLQWKFLPHTVQILVFWENTLSGPVDLTVLPPPLTVFRISENEFSGEIDLCHLPSNLKVLNLAKNNFSGMVRFDMLPQGLERILLYRNEELMGDMIISKLPPCLSIRYVQGTKIRVY